MATKRIIAYYMHEYEESAARSAMPTGASTQSYVVGDIDETLIDGLREKGLIIQEMVEPPLSPLVGLSPQLTAVVTKMGADFAAMDTALDFDPTVPRLYTISLAGPLLTEWRTQLTALDVNIVESIGAQRYVAEMQLHQAAAVRQLPFVTSVSVHNEQEQAPPIPSAQAGPPVDIGIDRILPYDIRLKSADDASTVLAFLEGRNALVAGHRGRKIRVHMSENSDVLPALGTMSEVMQVIEFVPPKLSNDRARVLVGVEGPTPPVTTLIHYDGTDQIIGIADTGIDDNHPDLQGRFVGISALGRTGDHSDPNGHGTHVAGSIGGDGSASQGAIKGIAPAVRFFFQSILDSDGKLSGLPWDLNDLFDEAYQRGVRIHNNSWGASTASRYTFNSIEVDEFVAAHRDMVIVIAAGNEGSASNPLNTSPGSVDWLSIGSPATAKNAITVGASQTDRTTGGYSTYTWGQTWPQHFPKPPIAVERISGNPDSMAAFSSRGPCDDRRIKPDVVAPGTDIASTKSALAPLRNFWGSYPGHSGHYAYMGGTSMAAPVVTGCLALIRHYLVKDRQHEPSAALLKAILINSTRHLKGDSSTANFNTLPNFHQGFGCVHMPSAIPTAQQNDFRLEFLDTWKDPTRQFTATGQRFRYLVSAKDTRPLQFCLAYTDLPARALQNDLNLFIQQVPNGRKWTGNEQLPLRISPVDAENNVEVVRIDTPVKGDYLIQITATNLLGTTGQDFALVVSGDLTSGLTLVP